MSDGATRFVSKIYFRSCDVLLKGSDMNVIITTPTAYVRIKDFIVYFRESAYVYTNIVEYNIAVVVN